MKYKSKHIVGAALIIGGLIFGVVSYLMDDQSVKLSSSSLNAKYDEPYWLGVYGQNKSVFDRAVQYCTNHPEKPNCAAVMSAHFDSGDIQK